MTLILTARTKGGGSDVIASLTRYDGSSGSTVFRGAIPFAPMMVQTVSDLNTMSVLVNGSEPLGGIYIKLLDGRHADGSYRSAYVEFTASCNSNETVPCKIKFATPRTVPDLVSPVDPVELSPRSWHAAATLFAVTDATYLCNARIMPLPLVPLTNPNLSAGVVNFLTTFHDSWATTTNQGNAGYDDNYPLICRYIMTGNPAWLAQACERNQSDNTPTVRQQIHWSYYVAQSNFPAPGTTPAGFVVLNPASYSTSRIGGGEPAEWQDVSLTQFALYQLTGWEYAKIHIERNATAYLAFGFSDYSSQSSQVAAYSPAATGNQGFPRQSMRWALQQGVLGAIIRMNRYIAVGASVFKSPADPYGNANLSMATRVQNRITRLEDYANGLNIGVDTPAWFPRVWGVNPALYTPAPGIPNFQFATAVSLWIAYLNGVDTRNTIPTQIDVIADWLQSQMLLVNGYWCMPYGMENPANITSSNANNNTLVVMCAWLLAWKWARTGNTTARDQYDALMAQTSIIYAANQTPVGPESPTRKNLGELWYLAYHAAALRAGVNPLTGV